MDPRGMTRSTTSCSARISETASRPSTRTMHSRSTPKAGMQSTMIWWRMALVLVASLPPLRRRPLPDRMAREAICGRASGLDSKMMRRTPRGAVTCSRVSPSATFILLSWRPSGSSMSAICLAPAASCAIFPGFILSLLRRCDSVSAASAAAMSFSFSRMMASSLASRASAIAYSSAARSSLLRFCAGSESGRRGTGSASG